MAGGRSGRQAGRRVAAAIGLVVLEAMKMEHEIRAARAGRVRRGIKAGDQVAPRQVLPCSRRFDS